VDGLAVDRLQSGSLNLRKYICTSRYAPDMVITLSELWHSSSSSSVKVGNVKWFTLQYRDEWLGVAVDRFGESE
jgi:hypothetical protein